MGACVNAIFFGVEDGCGLCLRVVAFGGGDVGRALSGTMMAVVVTYATLCT